MIIETKQCTKCRETKPLSEFYKLKLGKGGLESRCKICKRSYQQARSDEKREYDARRYTVNREGIIIYVTDWQKANPMWAASCRADKYGCPSKPIAHAVKIVEDDHEGTCYWWLFGFERGVGPLIGTRALRF